MVMDRELGGVSGLVAQRAAGRVLLSQWEGAMRRAQSAAHLGQVVQAQSACRHALQLARELLTDAPKGREDDCVAALVVSFHLLADLHADEGLVEAAALLVAQAHESVLALLADASHGMDLQQAALRHSRATHSELLGHIARHGSHRAIACALHAGCQALVAAGGRPPH